MLNITETWYKNIDERKLNVSVFLDLKKAFDTVDHDILLSKLSALGVIETTLIAVLGFNLGPLK